MTESGNHGGSSYEETDSLALFIYPSSKAPSDDVSVIKDTMNQVTDLIIVSCHNRYHVGNHLYAEILEVALTQNLFVITSYILISMFDG